MRILSLILAVMGALLATTIAAAANQRYALVVGNDGYLDVPKLELARADAVAISETLAGQGFKVTQILDASRRETNRQISIFTGQLQPGDTAFVFYAGHGVEIDGENYLLPIDIPAPAAGESDFIKSESLALSGLLDRIRATGARTTIAIIDACRDNPFATATGRSIGRTRGLGRINAPEGMFVIFSAGAGQLALDRLNDSDAGENSVFTRKLLPLLGQSGLELRQLMSQLRIDVRDLARTANHNQMPAYYDELLGKFYFIAAATPEATASEPEGSDAPSSKADQIRQDFALARSVGTVEAYDAFLARHGDDADDFSVQLATQLRDQSAANEPPTAAVEAATSNDSARRTQPPATQKSALANTATTKALSTPAPAPATDRQPSRREIIRKTQEHLNTLACNAGSADGILGRRTRAAFARFVDANGSSVGKDAIGTQIALDAAAASGATSCPPVKASQPAPSSTSINAQPSASKTSGLSLAGTWSFTANCALFIKSKGTARIRHVRDNFYTGSIQDNLGNTGNSETYLNGRDITSTEYFPGIVVHFRGRLAADGRSYTGSGSNTCKVYAQKN